MIPGHRCPAPGCPVQISPTQLTCREHWRGLPFQVRAAVLREWHRRPNSPAHRRAVFVALAWLSYPDEIAGGPPPLLELAADEAKDPPRHDRLDWPDSVGSRTEGRT